MLDFEPTLFFYIDLLNPSSKFASRLDSTVIYKRDVIKVFNIYHLLYNKLDIQEETSNYNVEMIDCISGMINSVIQNTYDMFNNCIFYIKIYN